MLLLGKERGIKAFYVKKFLKEEYKLRDFSNVLAITQYNTGLFMMFNNIQKCITYKKEKRRK